MKTKCDNYSDNYDCALELLEACPYLIPGTWSPECYKAEAIGPNPGETVHGVVMVKPEFTLDPDLFIRVDAWLDFNLVDGKRVWLLDTRHWLYLEEPYRRHKNLMVRTIPLVQIVSIRERSKIPSFNGRHGEPSLLFRQEGYHA